MSYEKQDWTDGEVINAEKLNHIETGVEDSSTTISVATTSYSDSSWQDCTMSGEEIANEIRKGKIVLLQTVVDQSGTKDIKKLYTIYYPIYAAYIQPTPRGGVNPSYVHFYSTENEIFLKVGPGNTVEEL